MTGKLTAISSCWNGQLLGLNFDFICITDIITKQCNKSEIHVPGANIKQMGFRRKSNDLFESVSQASYLTKPFLG